MPWEQAVMQRRNSRLNARLRRRPPDSAGELLELIHQVNRGSLIWAVTRVDHWLRFTLPRRPALARVRAHGWPRVGSMARATRAIHLIQRGMLRSLACLEHVECSYRCGGLIDGPVTTWLRPGEKIIGPLRTERD